MDAVSNVPGSMLDAKLEIPNDREEAVTLTKMEVIDAQSDVHLDDVSRNLSAQLLTHHVVNNEYSQHVTNTQYYGNAAEFLTSLPSDECRMELVAVQLIQDHQPNSPNSDSNLSSELLNVKTNLPSVSSLPHDANIMTRIVSSNYVHTIDMSDNPRQADVIQIPSEVHDQIILKASHSTDQPMKIYAPVIYQQEKISALPQLKKINTVPVQKYISSGSDNSFGTGVASNLLSKPAHQVSNDSDDGSNNSNVHSSEYNSNLHNCSEILCVKKKSPQKKRTLSKTKKIDVSTSDLSTKPSKCNMCDQVLPSSSALSTVNVHEHIVIDKATNFSCAICGQVSSNQLAFFEHLKGHYEPTIKSETALSKKPASLAQQNDIQISVIDTISCPDSRPLMKEESEIEAPNDAPPSFTCDKCGRVFRRQKAFDCHMSISHPKQEEIEEFSEPEDMMEGIRHVVNMVPTGDDEEKQYEINGNQSKDTLADSPSPILGSLSGPDSVTSKKNGGPSKGRKPVKCIHCPREFVHRNSLLYHIRSHTGQRPHQCEECGKSFFAAGALKIHMRLHSGDKPYKCEYCGKFFRQWGDLKYHFTSIHSNTRMFQCEFCGKDFARKYSLVVHRRIHTGEKNYICEFCSKTFRAASYLQNHRRIHTGEKPHECSVCRKSFRVRSDMKRHMKTHPNAILETANNSSDQFTDQVDTTNQEIVIALEEDKLSPDSVETDANIKPVITDVSSALNLNLRPATDEENIFNYQREDVIERNGGTSTVYLWIQTHGDSILPDN